MIGLAGASPSNPPAETQASNRIQPLLRFLTLVCLLGGLLGVSASAADPESALARFKLGNEHSARGDFKAAMGAYEDLARSGPVSANLFFNIGNTHFQTGNLGLAAVFFERALLLEPGHPEAEHNLQATLEKAGSSPQKTPRVMTFARHAAQVQPQGLWPVLGSLSFWILAAGVSGLWLFHSKSATGFAIGIGLLGVLTSAAIVLVQSTESRRALIIAPQTVALSAPADRAQTVMTLTAGVPVHILSERGPWTYCELPGQSKGWISAPQLERVFPAP